MDPKNYQLEELFRNAAERERLTPSPKVLRQLRFKLWLNEFLSPKPKKVNIFYVAVLAGSITIVSAIVKKTMHTNRVSPKQEKSRPRRDARHLPGARHELIRRQGDGARRSGKRRAV